VFVVFADVSPVEAVTQVVNVIVPWFSVAALMPVQVTVPTPAVPAFVAGVTVFVPSERVRWTVSAASEVAGSATFTVTEADIEPLM